MSSLWTAKDAAAATGGTVQGDWAVDGLSIDTREIQAGEMFIALKDQRDGHDFVVQALEKGASAALVSHIPEDVPKDAPLLIVDDVLTALENLAKAARARTKAKVIGVTGSVGKTTTKEMLRTALSASGKTHAAERSFNNHWGVPLTLAGMPADADFAVIEIGMNAPGEIAPLAKLADLDVAVVTIVAAAHLAAFESVDLIAKEKAAIFEGLRADGAAIINADLDTTPILAAAHQKPIRFGAVDGADFQLIQSHVSTNATTIKAMVNGEEIMFKLAAPGRHLAMNALAVLATCTASGADLAQSMMALGQWTAPDGRGTRTEIRLDDAQNAVIHLIDESYNANPTSMEAALDVLAASEPTDRVGKSGKGRRIAVLGDMLELGETEETLHAGLADLNAVDQIDLVHTSGPLMNSLHIALPDAKRGTHTENAADLAANIHHMLDAGDVIMVKGSNGSKISAVVRAIEKLGTPKGR